MARLSDIFVWVESFLSPTDRAQVRKAAPRQDPLAYSSTYHDLWLYRPWEPHRRRKWGFGIPRASQSCTHDSPNPKCILHYVWKFLTPAERTTMSRVCTEWALYPYLRRDTCRTSVASLRAPRPLPIPTSMDHQRARLHSMALLRFDFNYGDTIRWMAGEYTNRGRNWYTDWQNMVDSRVRPLPDHYPTPNYHLAYQAVTQGVPIRGNFMSPMQEVGVRNAYDNHPAVAANEATIETKFAKEEWRSYHLHVLRFLSAFIYGIIINPIQWAFDKGKGRICIDCTNGPDPAGSANTYIPKPGQGADEECPPIWYSFALQEFAREVYRLRLTRPTQPILVHADDIDAAFRRILYTPELAIAFAYVFKTYLIIPVGQCFGSRSAPSFYCLLADVRQALAATTPPAHPQHFTTLVTNCTFKVSSTDPLVRVPADSHHPKLSENEQACPTNKSFVDDNAVAAYAGDMPAALDNSVSSAYQTFGQPGVDRRGDCLQDAKWTTLVEERFIYLGFRFDTRAMTISWPLHKREALHRTLRDVLHRKIPKFVTPKEMASIIGVVRSASNVAPWGTFLSFNLQNALTKAARRAKETKRRWWTKARIYLSKTAIATIQQLMDTLLVPEGHRLWTCPLSLFVDRDRTHVILSDASYVGIGGWSPDFKFLWRIMRADLVAAGFNMKLVDAASEEPDRQSNEGLHINPLEFLATIINLWITLWIVQRSPEKVGGFILALLSDNTTALSWMSFASRTPDPMLQGLARFAATLLIEARNLLTKVCPQHIAGKLNTEADALSRTDPITHKIPQLSAVIAKCSRLQTCKICLLPSALLFELALICSSTKTVVTYDEMILILGSYLSTLRDGQNLQSLHLQGDTLRGYLTAAHMGLELITGRIINIRDPHSQSGIPQLHRFLREQLAQRKNWAKPKPLKEPYTTLMFEWLSRHLQMLATTDPAAFLATPWCVYDTQRLGLFTGSRVAEYAQSKLRKGSRFNTIPCSIDAGEWAGMPIAFIANDFTLYTRDLQSIPLSSQLFDLHEKGQVQHLQICFRFDKSRHNFSIRKYQKTGHPIFCPVDAAVSILRRAALLSVATTEPLCAIRIYKDKYRFLRDADVTKVMRQAVVGAYPDPAHYLRQHIARIVPHSNRVTAAVVLQQGGATNDEIAHRLRWHIHSVPTYLRDCFQAVGTYLNQALLGALRST